MEGFELSPQQKQLWQLQATAPPSPHRAQGTIQITGKIEAPLLKLAIEKVISNHEILRTTFKSVAGMRFPFQVISPDAHFKFEQYDYTEIERSEQSSKIDLLWAQCDRAPLDFSENPLFQCIWIALSETTSLLLLNLPALYADTQGLDNLARKILNTYSTASSHASTAPDDILQYVDISEWQNQLLQDNEEDLIFSKAYWREQKIANGLSLQLPLEQQPNQKVAFEPRHCELTLPSSQVKKISTFIQQENVSLNLFFLTCWQVLLWRITQQSDLVVGVGSDLRQYEELQNTIGLLAKQLPLKCHFTKGLSFLEALKNTENALKDAYRWQERFSWDFITDAQQNETKAPFAPFGFEFTPLKPHLLEGIGFELIEHKVYCDQFKVKFNITHNQSASSEKLAAQLSYDASLLSEDYIQCLAEQLQTLISNIVTHPEISIEKIELISAAKRETILHQFNHTACDYPKDKCIHQLFEAQAQKTPDAVAVAFENEHLTYQQLNTKANQLAHYLQSMGVGAEVLVGIFVERSLDMLVGLLGILKAGGAYVPLDPSYPAERLSHMLSDSQLPFLLTQQHLRLKIPKTQAKIICLDENNPDLSNYSSANPSSDVPR
ncbi:MAG: condensation domain-containing protein [Cyanobacteria bacterium J06555_13]